MANNLITEAYLAANFSPKSGITPGTDDHVILDCTEILTRYHVTISPSTGSLCPKQSELTGSRYINESWGGGLVAYILQSDDPGYDVNTQHGLIVATADLTNAAWGCQGTLITGADGDAIGTGYQNTLDIINGCATLGIAARNCRAYSGGGYTDWFLPSINELAKLYIFKTLGYGSFVNDYYESSTEFTANNEKAITFTDGTQSSILKGTHDRVRPIRYF